MRWYPTRRFVGLSEQWVPTNGTDFRDDLATFDFTVCDRRCDGLTQPSIAAPTGRWWLAYDDGTVWPVEVEGCFFPGHWTVIPQAPAPDAGERRIEPTGRIFDSGFNRPTLP